MHDVVMARSLGRLGKAILCGGGAVGRQEAGMTGAGVSFGTRGVCPVRSGKDIKVTPLVAVDLERQDGQQQQI